MQSGKIRSVAIVGAGVGGLALARALTFLPSGVQTVHIYDRARDLKLNKGAGFGLNGGSVLLAKLGLAEEMQHIMTPLKRLRIRNSNGYTLLDADIPKILISAGRSATHDDQESPFHHHGVLFAGQTMWSDVHEILVDSLNPGVLNLDKNLASLKQQPHSSGVQLQFADGTTTEPYDLVVGADGINSTMRRLMFGENVPSYTGFQAHWGVSGKLVRDAPETVDLCWGSGCSAISFSAGGSKERHDVIVVMSRNKQRPPEVWDASQALDDCCTMLDESGMPQHLQELAGSCDRMFRLGVYHHKQLSTWVKGSNLVLMGDAAHAMSPFLGQGANQAIQDAYCLADKIMALNKDHYKTAQEALLAFERRRKPVTTGIVNISALLGRMETSAGMPTMLRDLLARALFGSGIFTKQLAKQCIPAV